MLTKNEDRVEISISPEKYLKNLEFKQLFRKFGACNPEILAKEIEVTMQNHP